MATATLTLTVSIAWWLRWYVLGVVLLYEVAGVRVDHASIERVLLRAVRIG